MSSRASWGKKERLLSYRFETGADRSAASLGTFFESVRLKGTPREHRDPIATSFRKRNTSIGASYEESLRNIDPFKHSPSYFYFLTWKCHSFPRLFPRAPSGSRINSRYERNSADKINRIKKEETKKKRISLIEASRASACPVAFFHREPRKFMPRPTGLL